MRVLCQDCDLHHPRIPLRGISFHDFCNNPEICEVYYAELEMEEGQYPVRCQECLDEEKKTGVEP
jgi:hypothetical protein